MPAKKRNGDDDGPGQGWIVTFTDCMTLLLCFFVMLLSYSSFSEEVFESLSGAFFSGLHEFNPYFQNTDNDSIILKKSINWNENDSGSDTMNDRFARSQKFPKHRPHISSQDAYKDRRVFYLPTESLFVGETAVWRPGPHKHLKMIASFLQKVPCQVIVGESRALKPSNTARVKLDRAIGVLDYLQQASGLEADQFSISASESGAAGTHGQGRPVIEVALLKREIGQ